MPQSMEWKASDSASAYQSRAKQKDLAVKFRCLTDEAYHLPLKPGRRRVVPQL